MKYPRADKVDVVIRADGSKQIGMGHIFPMITLAKELKQQGHQVSFLTHKDPSTLAALKKNRLVYYPISSPAAYGEISRVIGRIRPSLIIVNTWKNESKPHFLAMKSANSPLIGFHQMNFGLRECNVVINPLPSAFTKVNPNKVRARYYFGPDFIVFDQKSQMLSKKAKNYPEVIKKVIIVLGGTDCHNLSPKIKETISHTLPSAVIKIVRGELSQQELFLAIHDADIAITGGGNTIFEAAFLGTPSISLAQESWEEKTIQYAERHGTAVYSGFREVALDNIPEILKELTVKKRREMSSSGKKLVDGKGLQRIIAIIKDLL